MTWFQRARRRVIHEGDRLSANLMSLGLRGVRDFAGLPLVLAAHGAYDGDESARRFPLRNFMSLTDLRAQLEWLGQCGHRFISFTELARYLRGEADLPARSVHVLFDDGYRSLHDLILPLLSELGVPFSVGLVESFVRDGQLLWGDDLHCRIESNRRQIDAVNAVAPEVLRVAGFDDRECRIVYDVNQLKRVSDERRREVLAAVAALCPLAPDAVSDALRPLDAAQIARMRQAGVAFLAHSRSHPVLSSIESADTLHREVTNWDPSLLEPGCFVLPYGTPSETSPRVAVALRDSGVQFAFSMIPGFTDRVSPPLALNRISMQRGLSALRDQLARLPLDHTRSLRRS